MSRHRLFSGLLVGISIITLAACSGTSGGAKGIEPHKTAAPLPPSAVGQEQAPQEQEAAPTPTVGAAQTSPSIETTAPQTIEDRITRLEEAVGSLRTDYDRIMPAFASLNTTNERIQTLLDQIEKESGGAPKTDEAAKPSAPVKTEPQTSIAPVKADPNKPVTPAAMMKAPAKSDEAKATSESSITVKGVRIGEHPSKTRIVIDLVGSKKPDVTQDLDNTEKLLLIEMPATMWGGEKTGSPKASAMIAGWSAQEGENGTATLAIQLKKEAKILLTEYLPAQGGDPARMVIDIGAAGPER